ncbi:RDD family protein [Jidongwangia harbinensis]|uniref:RDD family protein n=1 Tax=Jidongwangia harbinensis TaxID=2878561 RepID=UPI001CD95353|nr:RDD family protein [Jidongwangia harbinensis]MCA2217958.1 RDD family protein [Jidongwangia harbinensis]
MTYTQQSLDVHVTGRRVVATLIDGLVLSIVSYFITQIFGTESTASGFDYTRLSFGGSLLVAAATVLYYILMEGLTGRTLGKMATGIRVVDEATGNRPSLGAATIRTLLRFVDGLFGYLVGFVIVLSTSRRRRLGDMAAKTQVVRG